MEPVKTVSSVEQRAPQVVRAAGVDGSSRAIVWTAAAGWETFFRADAAPNWHDLASDSRATLVKSGDGRRVWRLVIGDRSCYVKEFFRSTWRASVRHFLRGPNARIEWRAGLAAERRGVPCVQNVGCGIGQDRSFFVTQTLERASPLSSAWAETQHAGDRRSFNALTDGVALLLARAHDRGFVHGGDHPRNILFVANGPDGFDSCYTDVHSARVSERVSEDAAVRSLAQLHQWFRLRALRTQRFRFLRAYCLERSAGNAADVRRMVRRLAPGIEVETHAQAQRLWAKRDRRILGSNRHFAKLELRSGSRANVALRLRARDLYWPTSVPDRTRDQLRELLEGGSNDSRESQNTQRLEAIDGGIPLGVPWPRLRGHVDDQHGHASVAMAPDNANRHRFGDAPAIDACARGLGERLAWMWGGSPLQKAFVAGHRLRSRDLPCRWPLACFQGRASGGQTVCTLWLDPLPVTLDLPSAVKAVRGNPPARRRLSRSLARLVSLMSDRGASARRATRSTFAITESDKTAMIGEAMDISLGRRDVLPHRLRTTCALLSLLIREGVFRRTDGVRYLRMLESRDWKRMWRRVEGSVDHDHRKR